MKWVDGLTYRGWALKNQKKRLPKEDWHKWFAWYPIEVGETEDGTRKIKVWWQQVYRKGTHYGLEGWGTGWWSWQYRECEKK